MKNSIHILLTLLLVALFLPACNSNKSNSRTSRTPKKKVGVNFVETDQFSKVLEKAGRMDQLVFLDIYTTWCAPCKLMDEYVFTDKETEKFMNKNFVNYKVDAEKDNGQVVATIYSASVYPTLIFMNKEGEVLERREGATSITELRDMAHRALRSIGK